MAWVTAMKDVLSGLLTLSALYFYLTSAAQAVAAASSSGHQQQGAQLSPPPSSPPRPRHGQDRAYWLATILFALSLLAKPNAGLLVAGALDYLLVGRAARQVARWLWPWLALAAACAVWTKLVQPAAAAGTVAPWLRPLIAADALAFYLYKILWPTRLGLDYGRRPSVALAEGWAYVTWVVPAVVGLLLWSCRRRAPALLAAGVAFVAALTPVLGLIRFDFQTYSTVSDHYLYVPMFAVAFAVAWALSRVRPRPAVAISVWRRCRGRPGDPWRSQPNAE